jgi:hypothetical protein
VQAVALNGGFSVLTTVPDQQFLLTPWAGISRSLSCAALHLAASPEQPNIHHRTSFANSRRIPLFTYRSANAQSSRVISIDAIASMTSEVMVTQRFRHPAVSQHKNHNCNGRLTRYLHGDACLSFTGVQRF